MQWCSRWCVRKKIGNQWYTAIGFGYGENLSATQLALLVSIVGREEKAWANVKFKEKLMDINPRVEARRAILDATAPKSVNIEEKKSKGGAAYYVISEADQEEWLARISDLAKDAIGS